MRRAVGENGDAPAARLELGQRGARVGKGVEREIGVEQFAAQRAGSPTARDRKHSPAPARSASRNRRSGRRASRSRHIRAASPARFPKSAPRRGRPRRDAARSRHGRRTRCRRRRTRKHWRHSWLIPIGLISIAAITPIVDRSPAPSAASRSNGRGCRRRAHRRRRRARPRTAPAHRAWRSRIRRASWRSPRLWDSRSW